MVDRISNLPDELLLHILSFLPTKFAFTTTILSKRWISVVYSLSVLGFDYPTINDRAAFFRFRQSVNTFMHHPRFSSNRCLKKFLLNCSYKEGRRLDSHIVESWLETAKQHSVEEFHLNLNYQTLKPAVFVSRTLVVLKLNRIIIGSDTSCVHLPSLKTLVLILVYFQDRSDYINFLSACPILEDLHAECLFVNEINHYEKYAMLNSLTLSNLVIKCISSHLRSCTMSITNFDGLPNDLRFAAYILQNARLLQDMKIDLTPNDKLFLGKNQIIEELSSYPKISPRCKLSFEIN